MQGSEQDSELPTSVVLGGEPSSPQWPGEVGPGGSSLPPFGEVVRSVEG